MDLQFLGKKRAETCEASNKRKRRAVTKSEKLQSSCGVMNKNSKTVKQKKLCYRDWANQLPHDILHTILHMLLLSSERPDSFLRVCKRWSSFRSLSDKIASSHPPFLLIPSFPAGCEDLEFKGRFRMLSPAAPGTDAATCSSRCLQQLTLSLPRKIHPVVHSVHGNLLNVDTVFNRIILTTPFERKKKLLLFPELPSCNNSTSCCRFYISYTLALQRAVLVCNHNVLWTCDRFMKQPSWCSHFFGRPEDSPVRFANVGQTLLCLSRDGALHVFDYTKSPPYRRMGMGGLSSLTLADAGAGLHNSLFFPHIFTSRDRILFLLRCVPLNCTDSNLGKFEVYKYWGGTWIKCNKLHDCAVFVDAEGAATSCTNPSQWGGKENTLYLTGPSFEGWEVFPLDQPANLSRLPKPSQGGWPGRWPRPIWMLPTSCY